MTCQGQAASKQGGWASNLGLWDSRAGAKRQETSVYLRELGTCVPTSSPEMLTAAPVTTGRKCRQPKYVAFGR